MGQLARSHLAIERVGILVEVGRVEAHILVHVGDVIAHVAHLRREVRLDVARAATSTRWSPKPAEMPSSSAAVTLSAARPCVISHPLHVQTWSAQSSFASSPGRYLAMKL